MELTQRQIDTLDTPIRNQRIRVELLNDDLKPINSIEGYTIDGSITANANNTTRRSGSITMAIPNLEVNATTFLDKGPEDALIFAHNGYWIDKLIKIYIGIDNLASKDSETTWYKMGVFLIDTPTRDVSGTEYKISFNCADQSIKLTGDRQGQIMGLGLEIKSGEYVSTDYLNNINKVSLLNKFYGNCAIRPDGTQLVVWSGTDIKIYDISSASIIELANPTQLPTDTIYNIIFKPDSSQCVVNFRNTSTTSQYYIYDTTTTPYTYVGGDTADGIGTKDSTFSLDGSLLLSPSVVYDATTTPKYTYKGFFHSPTGFEGGKMKCALLPNNTNIVLVKNTDIGATPNVLAYDLSNPVEISSNVYQYNYLDNFANPFYYDNTEAVYDFDVSVDGTKIAMLLGKAPFISYLTLSGDLFTPRQIGGSPLLEAYRGCKFTDNGERLVCSPSELTEDNSVVMFDTSKSASATRLNDTFDMTNPISALPGMAITWMGATSDKIFLQFYNADTNSLFNNIYKIDRDYQFFLRTKTAEALTSVIEDLTTIKRYVIADMPADFKYLPTDIKVGTGSTVNDVLKKFNDILSTWQFYFDLDGVYRIEPIPSGANLPTYPLRRSHYLSVNTSSDYKNVKNQVVVYGKPLDSTYYVESSSKYVYVNPNYEANTIEGQTIYEAGAFYENIGINISEQDFPDRIVDMKWITQWNRFIAITLDANYHSKIYESKDGSNWTLSLNPSQAREFTAISPLGVVFEANWTNYYGSLDVALGNINWEGIAETNLGDIISATSTERLGSTGYNVGLFSQNAQTEEKCFVYGHKNNWQTIGLDEKLTLDSITYNTYAQFIIAVGASNCVIWKDGSTPEIYELPVGQQNAVAASSLGAEFVSVGNYGKGVFGYFDSQGTLNFEEIQLPTADNIIDIKYIKGYRDYTFQVLAATSDYLFGYYVATSKNHIFISEDGVSWAKYAKPSPVADVIASHYGAIVLASSELNNKTGNFIDIKFIPIEPEKGITYLTAPRLDVIGSDPEKFEWNGTQYVKTEQNPSTSVIIGSSITLKFDEFDITKIQAQKTNIAFTVPQHDTKWPDNQIVDSVEIYSGDSLVAKGMLKGFEMNSAVKYGDLEQGKIYILRFYAASYNDDGTINTSGEIAFELYSAQQPSACLVNDNLESPFYVNNDFGRINYYGGMATRTRILDADNKSIFNSGESYSIVLNNTEPLTALEDGTYVTFMPNHENMWQNGVLPTQIFIATNKNKDSINTGDSFIVKNASLMQRNKSTGKYEPVPEGKLAGDYTIYLIKYIASQNIFEFMGQSPKVLPLVLSGGEYDNIRADTLAYERCLWELYSHSNLQDNVTISVVPDFGADVNMKIMFLDPVYDMPEELQGYEKLAESRGLVVSTSDNKIFYVRDLESDPEPHITKSLTFPLGIGSTGQSATASRIYDSGNLLGNN